MLAMTDTCMPYWMTVKKDQIFRNHYLLIHKLIIKSVREKEVSDYRGPWFQGFQFKLFKVNLCMSIGRI